MNWHTALLAGLGFAIAAGLAAAVLALALIRSAVVLRRKDARARHGQRDVERYGAIDRETARAIGIGGGADFLHHGEPSA